MSWRDFLESTPVEKVEKAEKARWARAQNPLIPLFPPVAKSEKQDFISTASPRVELLALIKAVGHLYGFSAPEIEEAREIGFADIQAALRSYRDVATRYGLNVPIDDRVTCGECFRLVRGCCQAAKMGMMKDTNLDYKPVCEIQRRCEFFKIRH